MHIKIAIFRFAKVQIKDIRISEGPSYSLVSVGSLLSCALMQPKVVTDVEDEELRKQMEELQLANEEVAGDDDTSDQEAADIND